MPLSASFLMRQINEALKEGFSKANDRAHNESIDEALNEAETKRPNEAEIEAQQGREAK